MRGRLSRVVPEFQEILDRRVAKFKTNRSEEQRNIVAILQDFEHTLGFDLGEVPVAMKKTPQFKFRKPLFTIK